MAEDSAMKKEKRELYKKAQDMLVSTLVYSDDDPSDVFEIVNNEDFEEPQLELIFSSIVELSRRGESTDVISISKELEDGGFLEEVGGIKELYAMRDRGRRAAMETPRTVTARIVKESSAKSKIDELLKTYRDFFRDDSGTPASDALANIQSEMNEYLYRLSNESTMLELSAMAEIYSNLLEDRNEIAQKNAEISEGLLGIPTMLPSLNKYTGGWRSSQMITVGAGTGVGKSVFAVNAATGAIQSNKSVLFFSLEMEAVEIQDRIVSSVTSIPMNHLKRGQLNDDEKTTLEEALAELKQSNLTIDEDAKQTIDSIRAKCLKKAQSPEGLDFVIIDYLQLITPTGRYGSRQEAVADISRNVKLLAKQLQIPIMVLVQLNRKNTDDENELPTVDNIRESAAIGQDSDIVILLHRSKNPDEELPPTLIILEKQRNGESGKVIRCHSRLECSMFQEILSRKTVEEGYTEDEMSNLAAELEEDMEGFDDDLDDDLDDF